MYTKKVFFLALLTCLSTTINAQQKIKLTGLVVDESDLSIPYAAVGITSKGIGTSTTEDGTFSLLVSNSNLNDVLEVSSIGFETYKIKVQDYINLNEKKIVLKEAVTSLDEIVITNTEPDEYVKNALRKMSKTTINRGHQLKVLYRRFSTEDTKARFLVEHYMHVLDPGPRRGAYEGFEIVTGRKSADYRFLKKKLNFHPMSVMGNRNPIRTGFSIKDYNWERIGDSSYDGEDILIFEGREKKNKKNFIKLYIGLDTAGIYRVETSDLNSLYIYKKNEDGKLVLSYHNRTRVGQMKLTDLQKKILKTNRDYVTESYKHEVFVLGVETKPREVYKSEYKKIWQDMGEIKVDYKPEFWSTFSLPPETKFYKKSVQELESIYGVSLENQFKLVNN